MTTLLISSAFGIFWLVLLFVLCFVCVHVLRLARMGQAYRKSERPTSQPPPQPTKPNDEKKNSQEKDVAPIYYIVERKKRVKSNYSEPKQIRFK